MAPSITIQTIGDLLDGGIGLNGWCPSCQTGRPVDVEGLAARYGRDATYIKPDSPIRLRCKDCGARADYHLASVCTYNQGKQR